MEESLKRAKEDLQRRQDEDTYNLEGRITTLEIFMHRVEPYLKTMELIDPQRSGGA